MTRIRLGPGVVEDLERIAADMRDHESEHVKARAEEVVSAFDVLAGNPLIGHPVHADKRELVMGRGSRGYVALYRYVDVTDTVVVMALRAQREAGYAREA